MYNKLFTKILDSSIWLEPTPTRIVWLTFIAVMDEDGFAQFASVANVAHRARVTLEEAQTAIRAFEGPDTESSDPDNAGQRLERVPGGWMVLNAQKHRDMVTRAVIQNQTRERVRRFRAKQSNAYVTPVVLHGNADVTPSVSIARSEIEAKVIIKHTSANADFEQFRLAYPVSRRVGGKQGKSAFITAIRSHNGDSNLPAMLAALEQHKRSEQWQTPKLIPLMTTWLNQERWNQVLPELPAPSTPWCQHIPTCRGEQEHRKRRAQEEV